jgi:hypothetical protein
MKKFVFVLFLAIFSLLITSCDPKEPEEVKPAVLTVKIDSKWGSNPFEVQQVYTDNYGNRVRVDNFQSYISMLTLMKSDGSEVLLKDFHLQNFMDATTLTFEVPVGTYTGVRFGVGVPATYNMHVDPAGYPNSHPLSVAGSQGMFWTWNTGYIFTKFEGKADTTGTEGTDLLHSYSFHTGDNEGFTEYLSTSENIEMKAGVTTAMGINFHVDQIYGSGPEGIDVSTDNNASGASILGLKFVGRLNNSITID